MGRYSIPNAKQPEKQISFFFQFGLAPLEEWLFEAGNKYPDDAFQVPEIYFRRDGNEDESKKEEEVKEEAKKHFQDLSRKPSVKE